MWTSRARTRRSFVGPAVHATKKKPSMRPSIESYRRVRSAEFAARFYEKLLGSSAEIARTFERTDFARQRELFQHGVLMLLEYAEGKAVASMAMQRLGAMHGRGHLDVAPRLDTTWTACLIETLAEFDPEWTPELAAQWRHDLAPGIAFLASAHDASTSA
jgi:hemoglobin-like flavoprotein